MLDTKPLCSGAAAPYAASASVILFLEKYRNSGLVTPVTPEVLMRTGVPESLANRTLLSLKQLGFLGEDGLPTEILEELAKAGEQDYKDGLAALFRQVYAEVFIFVDPETASSQDIKDAFRGFVPRGQLPRMVTLFMGLCAYAGIVPEDRVVARTPRKKSDAVPPKKTSKRQKSSRLASKGFLAATEAKKGLPPLILGFMDSLPQEGEPLTEERIDEILEALPSILKFAYPLREAAPSIELEEEVEVP